MTEYNVKQISEMLEINARFKEKILTPEENMSSASDNAVSYFELYSRIALINRQLIEQRDRLAERKENKRK